MSERKRPIHRFQNHHVIAFLLISMMGSEYSRAVDAWGKKFAPPEIYFVSTSFNGKIVTSGIKGQENFLEVFVTSVANEAGQYTPDGLSYTVLVPSYVKLVGVTHRFPANRTTTIYEDNPRLTVTDTVWQGKPYRIIRKEIDPERAKGLFLTHPSGGMNVDTLWYRIDPDQEVPAEPQSIEVTIFNDGRPCHTDKSAFRIYEALEKPPRISPAHYKLWLYRGPRWRNGGWDELADALSKAGINAIQFVASSPLRPNSVNVAAEECMKEMRNRGFYIIVHRGGGYSFNNGPRSIYRQVQRGLGRYEDDPLAEGPRWFQDGDEGAMARMLPMADAALWNFEPGARVSLIPLDKWYTEQFKKLHGIPAEEEFDLVVDIRELGRTSNWVRQEQIDPEKLSGWIGLRRDLVALCIKNWVDFVRGINPEVETIVTEGYMRVKPDSDVGFDNYSHYVDYCQPMHFSGPAALHAMKEIHMKHAPNAQFIGCQSVSDGSYSPLFVSGEEIMLQQVGAALIGVKGVGIYAGLSLDAEDFVLLNRAMGFLGRNQDVIFEGTSDPDNVTLEFLPAAGVDWARDLTCRAYRGRKHNEYFVAANNFNQDTSCILKVTMSVGAGTWVIADEENKQILTSDGEREISSDLLARGIHLECPAYDFRGFRFIPASANVGKRVAGYELIDLRAPRE